MQKIFLKVCKNIFSRVSVLILIFQEVCLNPLKYMCRSTTVYDCLSFFFLCKIFKSNFTLSKKLHHLNLFLREIEKDAIVSDSLGETSSEELSATCVEDFMCIELEGERFPSSIHQSLGLSF